MRTLILPISVTSEATLKETNDKTNVHLPCSAKKVAHTLILQHFCAERRHDARLMLKNVLHYYTHYRNTALSN